MCYAHKRRLGPQHTRASPLRSYLLRDGDLHVDSRLDADAGDLLHNVSRRVQVDEALVDAQLEPVPRVGTWRSHDRRSGHSSLAYKGGGASTRGLQP